ncbi:A/G-specific adenine glycosylase [Haloferula sp. A504]|uniref:A/G-specific adenine glycosylase n=1 Tax=Haloferula sp. A504 TaxID=3373601 RepID=UPI0031C3FD1D|nr:A/G-specific adenine glycosylase [Verrucomicrobiaceae bacterium E54]
MLKPRFETDPLEDPGSFRRALAAWFRNHGRDYPWRRTRDPYAILVSEVMLQQTQIATVLGRGFYTRFLERFPDTATLAAAEDDALLKAWEGLGYYRRARMLREAARTVEDEHGGRFPDDFEAILALPGVGRYTAGAVWSFAFGKPAPIVDGNVARVLSRLLDSADPIDAGPTMKRLWEVAGELLDAADPRTHNSALMELGQSHCRPGVPDCLGCPAGKFCRCPEPAALPVKAKRVKATAVDEDLVFLRRGDRVLMRKLEEGRREGMWRLPEGGGVGEPVYQGKYGITRYRVTMRVRPAEKGRRAKSGEAWCELDELGKLVIPPADRKALRALLQDSEEIA